MLKWEVMNGELHPLLQKSLELRLQKPPCLQRLEALSLKLGSVATQFPAVHVAGTNGKGSVSTKIAKALHWSGKNVGLYTSPHIASYRERIQINGKQIDDVSCERLLNLIVATSKEPLGYFELLTLLAFCYFAEQKVDCAVIEVGLGGRLDTTNLVRPVLSVITSIDLDHTHILGKDLASIAREKAGIIKEGVPTLLGPHVKPLSVFESIAQLKHSPLFQAQGSFAHYEEENQAIASLALALLPFPIERKSIHMGLKSSPPCRFERVLSTVILDVAHNPSGLERAVERFLATYPDKKFRVLAAFSKDKAVDECLSVLQKSASALHLTHLPHMRLLQVGEPFEQAFQNAYRLAKDNEEMLLVCGSFFIMENARELAKLMSEKEGG